MSSTQGRMVTSWAARWDARVDEARERLRRRSPRAYRRLLAVSAVGYLLTDALLPPRRVRALALVLVAMTLLDSLATYVWVAREVAVEGNPVVDTVMGALGEGPALVLRTVVSMGFLVGLGWLARRHWEARTGMIVATVALTAVTLIHLYGLITVVN